MKADPEDAIEPETTTSTHSADPADPADANQTQNVNAIPSAKPEAANESDMANNTYHVQPNESVEIQDVAKPSSIEPQAIAESPSSQPQTVAESLSVNPQAIVQSRRIEFPVNEQLKIECHIYLLRILEPEAVEPHTFEPISEENQASRVGSQVFPTVEPHTTASFKIEEVGIANIGIAATATMGNEVSNLDVPGIPSGAVAPDSQEDETVTPDVTSDVTFDAGKTQHIEPQQLTNPVNASAVSVENKPTSNEGADVIVKKISKMELISKRDPSPRLHDVENSSMGTNENLSLHQSLTVASVDQTASEPAPQPLKARQVRYANFIENKRRLQRERRAARLAREEPAKETGYRDVEPRQGNQLSRGLHSTGESSSIGDRIPSHLNPRAELTSENQQPVRLNSTAQKNNDSSNREGKAQSMKGMSVYVCCWNGCAAINTKGQSGNVVEPGARASSLRDHQFRSEEQQSNPGSKETASSKAWDASRMGGFTGGDRKPNDPTHDDVSTPSSGSATKSAVAEGAKGNNQTHDTNDIPGNKDGNVRQQSEVQATIGTQHESHATPVQPLNNNQPPSPADNVNVGRASEGPDTVKRYKPENNPNDWDVSKEWDDETSDAETARPPEIDRSRGRGGRKAPTWRKVRKLPGGGDEREGDPRIEAWNRDRERNWKWNRNRNRYRDWDRDTSGNGNGNSNKGGWRGDYPNPSQQPSPPPITPNPQTTTTLANINCNTNSYRLNPITERSSSFSHPHPHPHPHPNLILHPCPNSTPYLHLNPPQHPQVRLRIPVRSS